MFGFSVWGEGGLVAFGQDLDGFCEVGVGDVVGVGGNAEVVGFIEDLGMGAASGRFKFVVGEFVTLSEGVAEVDGVHEAPVYLARIRDAPVVEPLFGFDKGGAGDGEGDVVDVSDTFGVGGGVYFAVFVGEDGDETAVAGVKIEVAFFFTVEIGLFKDEGHAKYAFPEVDGRLAGCADDGDVMNTLSGDFFHFESFF